jgi:hypothetical protein
MLENEEQEADNTGAEPVNQETGNLKATELEIETDDVPVDVRAAQTPDGYAVHDDPDNDRSVFEITDVTAIDAYHQGIKSGDKRHWARHAVTNELKKFVNDNSKATQVFVKIGDQYNRVR